MQIFKSKKLLLASAIALTLGTTSAISSKVQISEDLAKSGISGTGDNTEEVAYYVRYQQTAVKSEFQSSLVSLGAKIKYDLSDYNTYTVTIPKNKLANLKRLANIEFIEPVPVRKMMAQEVPWNIDQFQARDAWDWNRDGSVDIDGVDGSGLKFCIIDSGFFAPHEDFQGVTHTGMSQVPGEVYSEDGDGHGTHVAGTVSAMNNDLGVVGVMPGTADLIIVKIFNNNGVWSPGNSDLATAATYCKDQGANIISMSLGGGFSSTENNVFQDLYDNHNIISIAAAGNDANATESFPASYESVISVAALRESENVANFSQYPPTSHDPDNPPANTEWDVVELSGGGESVLSTWSSYFQVTNDGVDYSATQMAQTSFGDVTANLVDGGLCDSVGSWSGNVVLCQRGAITFAEKMNNAADGGAVAAIIYNNEAGILNGTCADNCTSGALIPGVSITQSDGEFLFNNGLGLPTRVLSEAGSAGDCVTCNGGYNTISGTSMATPGVAAATALVWDACGGPGVVSNKEIRQLLRDSAKDLSGTHDLSGNSYGEGYDDHTGFGLVQVRKAVDLGRILIGSNCTLDNVPDNIFDNSFD